MGRLDGSVSSRPGWGLVAVTALVGALVLTSHAQVRLGRVIGPVEEEEDTRLEHAQSLPLISDQPFNSITADSWFETPGAGDVAAAITTDGTAPTSCCNVLVQDMAGTDADSGPGTITRVFTGIDEVYVEWWAKYSTDFPASPAGVAKTSYHHVPTLGSTWWGVVCQTSNGACPSAPTATMNLTFMVYFQWDPHLGGDQHNPDPMTTPTFQLNQWVKLATYFKGETSSNPSHTGDGITSMWMNDTLVFDFTDRSDPNELVMQWQLAPIVQNAVSSALHAKVFVDHVTIRGQ
jgi:hypothetical protein